MAARAWCECILLESLAGWIRKKRDADFGRPVFISCPHHNHRGYARPIRTRPLALSSESQNGGLAQKLLGSGFSPVDHSATVEYRGAVPL